MWSVSQSHWSTVRSVRWSSVLSNGWTNTILSVSLARFCAAWRKRLCSTATRQRHVLDTRAAGGGKPFVIDEAEYHCQIHHGPIWSWASDPTAIARKCNDLGYRTRRGNRMERRSIERAAQSVLCRYCDLEWHFLRRYPRDAAGSGTLSGAYQAHGCPQTLS